MDPAAPAAPLSKRDADEIRLLAIFHFVIAGIAVCGLGFLALHDTVMSLVFNNPEMWKNTLPGARSTPYD